jgi:hypothetical protein
VGKTTDAYMNSIDKLNSDCIDKCKELFGYFNGIRGIAADLARNLEAQHRRVIEVAGVDPERVQKLTQQQEEAANSDAELTRMSEAAERLMDQKLDLAKEKSKADDNAVDALNTMSNKIEQFRAYVKKKQASKNPFKSKKSLPAAWAYIKKADDTVDEIVKAIKATR